MTTRLEAVPSSKDLGDGSAPAAAPPSIFDAGALSPNHAAAFLDVSRATIYRMMEAGELPYSIVRGERRIPKRTLVELLEQGMRGARSAG